MRATQRRGKPGQLERFIESLQVDRRKDVGVVVQGELAKDAPYLSRRRKLRMTI
jgi:hypothetical protein